MNCYTFYEIKIIKIHTRNVIVSCHSQRIRLLTTIKQNENRTKGVPKNDKQEQYLG